MTSSRTLVLDHQSILQKLRRIAYQIIESNAGEKSVVIVAVAHKGSTLATRILPILKAVAPFEIELIHIEIDRKEPMDKPTWEGDPNLLENKAVVLIDDVLNSGHTLMYAARHIVDFHVKRLKTIVLVDRLHRRFPIKADFVGLTLSTTLQDHINVVFEEGNDAVYLE